MNKTDLRKGMTAKKTLLCSETLENQCIIVSLKIFIFADRLKVEVNRYNNLKQPESNEAGYDCYP